MWVSRAHSSSCLGCVWDAVTKRTGFTSFNTMHTDTAPSHTPALHLRSRNPPQSLGAPAVLAELPPSHGPPEELGPHPPGRLLSTTPMALKSYCTRPLASPMQTSYPHLIQHPPTQAGLLLFFTIFQHPCLRHLPTHHTENLAKCCSFTLVTFLKPAPPLEPQCCCREGRSRTVEAADSVIPLYALASVQTIPTPYSITQWLIGNLQLKIYH